MLKANCDQDRERQIGRRLRRFREQLLISRSAFAVSLGIGSERLASYESGRVPLKYAVFLSIHKHYRLNPFWLVAGEEPSICEFSMDFGRAVNFLMAENPNMRFSEAYDRHLVHHGATHDRMAKTLLIRALHQLPMQDDVGCTPELLEHVNRVLNDLSKMFKAGSFSLTKTSEIRNTASVQPLTLNELLERTREKVKPAGAKAALAKHLGVPQSRVSEWLSGKYSPSGEVTLRLLSWVTSPSTQQNTPESAVNTPEGKTTQMKGSLSHETDQSKGRKKE
jgi:transcriptional regulator with XRE-family HTH domain